MFVYGDHVAIAPARFDPQEVPAVITPWAFLYAIPDGLVHSMSGQPFTPSLAKSSDLPPDFKSATLKLWPGIKLYNGGPLTTENIKWSFEKYRGANAKFLHDKTNRIETPDDRTIKFVFKEPILDFLVLYGSPASGVGWIVPKKYGEQVGADGFNPKERERRLIEKASLEIYLLVPVFRLALLNAQGPRLANQWDEISGVIPQDVDVGPSEDVRRKE